MYINALHTMKDGILFQFLCVFLLMVEAEILPNFGVLNPRCALQAMYILACAVPHTGMSRQLGLDMKIWPQGEKIKVISIFEC